MGHESLRFPLRCLSPEQPRFQVGNPAGRSWGFVCRRPSLHTAVGAALVLQNRGQEQQLSLLSAFYFKYGQVRF